MATVSEVKASLDEISSDIKARRLNMATAKRVVQEQADALADIPTRFAGVMAEITGYAPTGAFETLAKDEMAKLTSEYQALKVEVDAALIELNAHTEF